MSGFKFNFSCTPGTNQDEGERLPQNISSDDRSASSTVLIDNTLPARLHELNQTIYKQISDAAGARDKLSCAVGEQETSSVRLKYFDSDFVVSTLNSSNERNTKDLCNLMVSSDLVSGVYEGGFKVWECAVDLIDYITFIGLECIADKKILELGCGAGLPGTACLLNGAKSVTFQDYNPEVIDHFTIPTVLLNTTGTTESNYDVEFISGDWGSVNQLLIESQKPNEFNIILSAETIYNVDNYEKLHRFLVDHLSTTGMALFAAKSFYFGVGGGVDSFAHFVKSKQFFSIRSVKEISSNVKREVLEIKWL